MPKKISSEPESLKKTIPPVLQSFRYLLDLSFGQAPPEQVMEEISGSAELRSANLWVLLLAILIASVGLNTNSAAVIIGAMLISPLMGPILAIGLGVSINDFELLRKGAINLSIAAVGSILVSTIYFAISPLDIESDELLARTTPTAWEAFVAIFGGLAGAIGITRSEKTNVIPGVAIATALMPPLCTAGYGLASGNFKYFAGAIYLFYINSICIALGAFVVCRILRYPQVSYLDPQNKKRVRQMIAAVVIISVIPSAYFGYNLVQKTIFEKNVRQFISKEIESTDSQILNKTISFDKSRIDIMIVGKPLSVEEKERLTSRLTNYDLEGIDLKIRSSFDFESRTGASRPSEEDLKAREEANLNQLLAEMKAIFPEVLGLAVANAPLVTSGEETRYITVVYINSKNGLNISEKKKMVEWLEVRTGNQVKIIID